MKKQYFIGVAFLFLLIVCFLCLIPKKQKSDCKVCKIGLDINYKPMSYKTNNKYIGFECDIVKEVFNNKKEKYKFVEIEWDKKIDYLQSGKIDCIISGLTIDLEREKIMDFSKPYFNNELYILCNNDSKTNITAFPIGTASVNIFDKYSGSNKQIYDNYMLAVDDLKKGNIKELVLDSVHVLEKNLELNDYVVKKYSNYIEKYAVGFPKKSKWKTFFDKELDRMNDTKRIDYIYKKWFFDKVDYGIVKE